MPLRRVMKRSSTPSRHNRPYSLRRTCGRDAMEMQSAASRQSLHYVTEETAGVAARHTSVGGECASPEHAHLTATLHVHEQWRRRDGMPELHCARAPSYVRPKAADRALGHVAMMTWHVYTHTHTHTHTAFCVVSVRDVA